VHPIRAILNRIFGKSTGELPPGSSRAERGRYGEDRAEQFCREELGYRILARNWRKGRDELDLVCMDNGVIVFIEVRARSEHALVHGYASVDTRKKKVLLRACKSYLKGLHKRPKHYRFDIIAITLKEGSCGELHHYANVPLFHKHYTA